MLFTDYARQTSVSLAYTAINQGYPVVTVEDNGFPTIYHPSERRTDLCRSNKLLIVTRWLYAYRRVNETITEAE